jgi:class II aldolase/adducin family protein
MIFACTEPAALFSKDAKSLKPALYDLAGIVGTDIKIAEDTTSKALLSALKDRAGCLVRGKGIFSASDNMKDAISIIKIIEKSIEAEMYGDKIGGIKHLTDEEALRTRQMHNHLYSNVNSEKHVDFVNISTDELDIRNNIIDCTNKLKDLGLFHGSWGNLSVRLNDHEMLITPSAMEYNNIRAEDIVKVDINTLAFDHIQRVPSSEFDLHAAIYREHPDWNAIIRTHSHGLSVFAAAQVGFKITDPALRQLLGDVSASEHVEPHTPEFIDSILKKLKHNNICVIANRGPIFCATSLENAIVMADTIEDTACNMLGYNESLLKSEDN